MQRSGMMFLGMIVVAALLCLPAVTGTVPASAATPAPKSSDGFIVFQSTDDGDAELYVMRADGSDVSRLTKNTHPDTAPSWSSDGKKIAFMSLKGENLDIYVVNADGSEIIQLTSLPSNEALPVWSPDDKQIVYSSDFEGAEKLYVMNLADRKSRLLTEGGEANYFPAWSPDGKLIAFVSDRDGASNIYVIKVGGGDAEQLTTEGALTPSWSPDSKKIAYAARTRQGYQIFVMDADGGNPKQITRSSTTGNVYPSWSPDGKQLVYMAAAEDKPNEIWVVNADGRNPKRISPRGMDAGYPNWSRVKPPVELPLAPIVAQCPTTTDETYGYEAENPITVGNGDFLAGPSLERAFLDSIRGPNGQQLRYKRLGSQPGGKDGAVIVDRYEVTYTGLKTPILLYIDMYTEEPPKVPVGFTCAE